MPPAYRFLPITLATIPVAVLLVAANPAPPRQSPANRAVAQEALGRFNPLIGGWRGVGQPRRGSAKGAWSEKANWTWEFDKARGTVGVRYHAKGSKLLTSGLFGYDPQKKTFTLNAVFSDKTRRTYRGKPGPKGRLILESLPDKDGHVYRLTVRQLNDKRTLVLHERRKVGSKFYTRVAGIGYTRQGTRLASSNAGGPVCIVTEGLGTSKVSYKGKTYWVCCSGCRDAFLDDPEGILAAARERTAKRKKKKKTSPRG